MCAPLCAPNPDEAIGKMIEKGRVLRALFKQLTEELIKEPLVISRDLEADPYRRKNVTVNIVFGFSLRELKHKSSGADHEFDGMAESLRFMIKHSHQWNEIEEILREFRKTEPDFGWRLVITTERRKAPRSDRTAVSSGRYLLAVNPPSN